MTNISDPLGDELLYHFSSSQFDFEQYCEHFIHDKYPPLGFYDFQFNMVVTSRSYFDLANMPDYIKDNEDAITAYRNARGSVLKANDKIVPQLCKALSDRDWETTMLN